MNDKLLNALLTVKGELEKVKSCSECPVRTTCDACIERGMENLCVLTECMLKDVEHKKEEPIIDDIMGFKFKVKEILEDGTRVLDTSTGIEYKELLEELELLTDKIISTKLLDELFEKYDWECMGFNKDFTELVYIESPMGKEIDLIIETIEKFETIIIKSIKKKYFN